MAFPTMTKWKSDTSRWWSSRSNSLKAVDTALNDFNLNKTHDNFKALANALKTWMESKDDWTKSTRNTGWNKNVVSDLVEEIADSEYWRGARDNTPMGATQAFFQQYASSAAQDSYNREFLTDPAGFLSTHTVYCYNVEAVDTLGSYGLTNSDLGGRQALSFEFVREEKSGADVFLKIAPNGKLGDDQIKGGWIPYRGQSATPDPSLFGHLAILGSDYDFIFTVGLGGCRIAVVKAKNGIIHMYHEPTQDAWGKSVEYDGDLLGYYAPDYDSVLAGFTCFEKKGGIWHAHVQEIAVTGGVGSLTTTKLEF